MTDLTVLGHAIFVILHAAAAVVALLSGIIALNAGHGLGVHRISIVVMAVTLGPSMAFGWAGFPPVARVMFSGLAVLALAMVIQAFRAGRVRAAEIAAGRVWRSGDTPKIGPGFVRVLGFNVISLTVAGTIVPVLRIGGGTLGVLAAVVITVVVAHLLVERRRSQVLAVISRQEPVPVS